MQTVMYVLEMNMRIGTFYFYCGYSCIGYEYTGWFPI